MLGIRGEQGAGIIGERCWRKGQEKTSRERERRKKVGSRGGSKWNWTEEVASESPKGGCALEQ